MLFTYVLCSCCGLCVVVVPVAVVTADVSPPLVLVAPTPHSPARGAAYGDIVTIYCGRLEFLWQLAGYSVQK